MLMTSLRIGMILGINVVPPRDSSLTKSNQSSIILIRYGIDPQYFFHGIGGFIGSLLKVFSLNSAEGI